MINQEPINPIDWIDNEPSHSEIKNFTPKPYRLDETLKGMADINFVGHIIPHTWKFFIAFENGKPDLLGMMILSDIVYWYRPTVKRSEQTGAIIGYQKKFHADKLHCNINTIAKQNGVSYRQAADALARLEKNGFIQKECRIIETGYGAKGNVLYINPVVDSIKRISQLPQDLSEITHSEQESDFIPVTPLCNELPKGVTSNEIPLGNLLQPLTQSITTPHVTDRQHTKNTTKITAKNTTAEAANGNSIDSKMMRAAAAVIKKENRQPVLSDVNLHHLAQTEAFIDEMLTEKQKAHVEKNIRSLSLDDLMTQQLMREIEAGLIDSQCFTKSGNDFHRKLSAILKTVKSGQWTPPASLHAKKINAMNEEQKYVDVQKRELLLKHNNLSNDYGKLFFFIEQATTSGLKASLQTQQRQRAVEIKTIETALLLIEPAFKFPALKSMEEEPELCPF